MSFDEKSIEVSFRSKKKFFYRIRKFLKRVRHGFTRWQISEKNCRHLLEMNDYYLKDIGISRADALRFSRQKDSLWKCILENPDAENCEDVI